MDDQQEPREDIDSTGQAVPAPDPSPPSQEELHRLYLEQQRRLACPGCGEAPFLG